MTTRLFAAVMAIAMCGLANAATINVPADYTTIQAAIDAASNGDEILVAPGTYTGTGGEVVNTLGKAITIKASGTPEETIIDGEGASRVVLCNNSEGANTIIEGFTIMGGSAYRGGGIYCDVSSPTISGCTISGNTAEYGGGIYCSDNSNPTISGCTITGNTAKEFGGGFYCDVSSLTITGCTISNNTASSSGGGILCYGGSPTITGCNISNNTTGNDGGGSTAMEAAASRSQTAQSQAILQGVLVAACWLVAHAEFKTPASAAMSPQNRKFSATTPTTAATPLPRSARGTKVPAAQATILRAWSQPRKTVSTSASPGSVKAQPATTRHAQHPASAT